jgi:putative hydrolase of the HAD superfamily
MPAAHYEETTIAAVALDAVGTLIEPAPGVAVVYAAAARRQGVVLDPDLVRARFQTSFGRDEIDELRGPRATDEPTELRRWRRIVTDVLPELPDPGRAFEELWEHFGRPAAWHVLDDVPEALRRFAAMGLRVAVASNFDRRLRGVLAGLPVLAECQAKLVVSSEVGYRKPDPAFYRALCAHLEERPDRILCAGDDVANDYEGPRGAGLNACLIDRHGRLPAQLPRYASLVALADDLAAKRGRGPIS